ncbi:MAG TPA: threonine--tRNA ligase [Leucothrix mucor]|uniref:Threonine--tRNA ligase n=1 Tax=Leucothrix mucor TaxID=45248 RepID=A0A7V2T3U6_LEUMU|nr:threonine--tRNA ligase [Leucothrix mucor]
MPIITLPDGSQRSFDHPISILDVAADIGPGLAKATLAGKINGEILDASHLIETNCELQIFTNSSDEGLEVIRHSSAHLMAQAVKQLFPEAQVTIGPVIEDGFFYDFSYQRAFTPEDVSAIEKRMQEIIKQDIPIERSVMARDEAVAFFKEMGEEYKAEIIADIPSDEDLSLYRQGDFIDLCRGPHVPSTGKIPAIKLMKLAGAYWRGDSNNEMLQRIYGTAWSNKKQLKAYIRRIEEAEKRDHRKIARKLDLFHIQEEAPGQVFWHAKGWTIYQAIAQYMREQQRLRGYQEINTPQLVDFSLWERSGHAAKYSDDMFSLESDNRQFALKPMNCPCHLQVFNQGLKSYRDLPLRLAEFGSCHRNEMSGALHGLMRVRAFVQDDGHTFCTEDQIQSEVAEFIDFLHDVYKDFGFDEVIYRLSTRPENRVGSDENWDKSEKALADALDAKELDWEELPGEGAFYGPKIEFSLKDSIGRVWQLGTIQVDFSMPERLDAQYVAENGSRQTPVMLHRAILGSFERFIGILIEHHEGRFPLWLSPEQAVVMNITDKQSDFVHSVVDRLKKSGIRAVSDLRNEKIGFKIREHTLQRIPYLLVVGDREVEADSVAVRTRSGEDLGTLSVSDLIKTINSEVATRS